MFLVTDKARPLTCPRKAHILLMIMSVIIGNTAKPALQHPPEQLKWFQNKTKTFFSWYLHCSCCAKNINVCPVWSARATVCRGRKYCLFKINLWFELHLKRYTEPFLWFLRLCFVLFSLFKTTLVFENSAVLLQKCFVDYKISSNFTSTWEKRDKDRILIFGWKLWRWSEFQSCCLKSDNPCI